MEDFKDAPKSLIKRLNKSVSKKDRKRALKLAKQFKCLTIKGDKIIKSK